MKKATTVLHFCGLIISEVMGLSPNCIGTSLQWYELEVVRVDDGTSLQIFVRVDSGTS